MQKNLIGYISTAVSWRKRGVGERERERAEQEVANIMNEEGGGINMSVRLENERMFQLLQRKECSSC